MPIPLKIKTGRWYYDRFITLAFPENWEILVHKTETPPPLGDLEISAIISAPVGQVPLHEYAKRKKKPIIVVDDLSRPTPISKILPHIIQQLKISDVPIDKVRLLVATGTHGKQKEDGLKAKLGKEALEHLKVVVHDDRQGIRYLGKTSFGTPMYINKELLDCDLVIGISGVYPHHLAGFSGGSKLALGILGRKSIQTLHYLREGCTETGSIDNNFRKDLTEIARSIGMNTMCTVQIDHNGEIVQCWYGDHDQYYPEACRLYLERCKVPRPIDADVVLVNAYPFDGSYSMMRKAFRPFSHTPASATRIIIATNGEGLGTHGLNPVITTKWTRSQQLMNKASAMGVQKTTNKILKNFFKKVNSTEAGSNNENVASSPDIYPGPIWVYQPIKHEDSTLKKYRDRLNILHDWDHVLSKIYREQRGKRNIKVAFYMSGGLCII